MTEVRTVVTREEYPHLWSFFQIVEATFVDGQTEAGPRLYPGLYPYLLRTPDEVAHIDQSIARWTLAEVADLAGVASGGDKGLSLYTDVGRAVAEVLVPL